MKYFAKKNGLENKQAYHLNSIDIISNSQLRHFQANHISIKVSKRAGQTHENFNTFYNVVSPRACCSEMLRGSRLNPDARRIMRKLEGIGFAEFHNSVNI